MKYFIVLVMAFCFASADAQLSRDEISTDFVLYKRRVDFDRNMRERTIKETFAAPLDSNTEDRYREACWAISQFMLRSAEIENGFNTLFEHYTTIDNSTKRALLEAVYATYPQHYKKDVEKLLVDEAVPKLFAMEAVYLYRADKSPQHAAQLVELLARKFPNADEDPLLQQLKDYLQVHETRMTARIPDPTVLFRYRRNVGEKTIYSLQRWNRDYPGMAIVQEADGRFARDSSGKLLVFQQLARSGSDLPYFITNGSTPQGAFSIQGTEVSHNNFIGPTPNIQLVMPNESDSLFWHGRYDSTRTPLDNYLSLFPVSWRNYAPMTESYYAGKVGRTEIIAHGTTIDPDYFKDQPFYPLTPTLGCLCAKETWNIFNGKFLQSDQFGLAQTFTRTPGNTGMLYVINLDNQQKAVTADELEKIVSAYESKN